METVFGMKWPIPTVYDISLVLGIISILLIILLILKYILKMKEKQAHLYQLLLFKARQLGLTNYQIKILNSIAGLLKNKNPTIIFNSPYFFESTIKKFLSFLNTQDENADSLDQIYKDIIMIYEKIYHSSEFKKPLENIDQLETGQMLYFNINNKKYFLGKVTKTEPDNILIDLLNREGLLSREKNNINNMIEESIDINVYFWRTGDAEYMFKSKISAINKNKMIISVPDKLTRGEEERHPSVKIDIPCKISFNPHPAKDIIEDENAGQASSDEQTAKIEYDEIEASILKININEALVMVDQNLLYDYEYFLSFELDGFKIKLVSEVISKKTIRYSNYFYYTLKFKDITDASKKVLHKFMLESLE